MNFLKARMSDTRNGIIVVLILDLLKLSTADAECNCTCENERSPCDLFETVSHIKTQMKLFENHILQLMSQQHQLRILNNKFSVNQNELQKLEQQLQELTTSSFPTTTTAPLPVTEPLINVPEELKKPGVTGSFIEETVTRPLGPPTNKIKKKKKTKVSLEGKENLEVSSKNETLQDGDQELPSLRAAVEGLENKSLEVKEELESERRVRRHIQEDLGKTQTYIRLLDTKLENVTIPADNRMNQIEEGVISKLKNLNKTIVEDYLKELEYKINDVAYKNKIRQLENRLEEIEHQILNPENFHSKVKETFSRFLENLTGSIENKIISEHRILGTIDNNFKNELKSFRSESNSLRNDVLSLRNDFEEIQNDTKTITEIVSENKENLANISLEAKFLSNQVSSAFGELDDMKMEFAGLQEKISTAANVATTHNPGGKSEIKTNFPSNINL